MTDKLLTGVIYMSKQDKIKMIQNKIKAGLYKIDSDKLAIEILKKGLKKCIN